MWWMVSLDSVPCLGLALCDLELSLLSGASSLAVFSSVSRFSGVSALSCVPECFAL